MANNCYIYTRILHDYVYCVYIFTYTRIKYIRILYIQYMYTMWPIKELFFLVQQSKGCLDVFEDCPFEGLRLLQLLCLSGQRDWEEVPTWRSAQGVGQGDLFRGWVVKRLGFSLVYLVRCGLRLGFTSNHWKKGGLKLKHVFHFMGLCSSSFHLGFGLANGWFQVAGSYAHSRRYFLCWVILS